MNTFCIEAKKIKLRADCCVCLPVHEFPCALTWKHVSTCVDNLGLLDKHRVGEQMMMVKLFAGSCAER